MDAGIDLKVEYLAKLLRNEAVAAYLRAEEPELLSEFESIVQTTSLG